VNERDKESRKLARKTVMIQNERQYRITQTKLREFEQDLASLNPPDPNLHPRQVVG
jgi:hypothetical protein